jgi:ubiquinone/menaquinone biosynthesis C-methylase UbiE
LKNIYDLAVPNESFDVVIAGQVLHLIDNPNKAAKELRRVTARLVLLPLSFTKGLKGFTKIKMDLYKLFGFSPKVELAVDEYKNFLNSIGFEVSEIIHCEGKVPMSIAVWYKA